MVFTVQIIKANDEEKIISNELLKDAKKSRLVGLALDDIIVVKPWGFEYMNYESPDKKCCSWFLHINKGMGTSMHCHTHKKTLLHVISGQILLILYHRKIMIFNAGESISFDEKVFHAMYALLEDTRLIEAETPSDKPDAVRLLDNWKRVCEPYESKCLIMRYK